MFFRDHSEASPRSPEPTDPLDQVLLAFSDTDTFTIRDACQGVQIFGETGSGKTSGSGRYLAHGYLQAGFGGLVLTANPDDADMWRKYAAQTGRTADLIFFGPNHPNSFNFLEYESANAESKAGVTRNTVDLFHSLTELASGGSQKGASANDSYWQNELKKLIANAADLIRFGEATLTLKGIYDVVLSGPRKIEAVADPMFQKHSTCGRLCLEIKKRLKNNEIPLNEIDDVNLTLGYWTQEFPRLDDKPRGSIIGSFSGLAEYFLRGAFRSLFLEKTTISPELSFAGKIIVLDIPVKQFKALGIAGQMVFKYCWQKAVERRLIQKDSRPVFLWADEAQYFVGSHDVLFQTTARSSRVCTVYLTQNLPNYQYRFEAISGSGQAMTHSLMGNLATKIFHSNTCAVTNRFASDLFAKGWRSRKTRGLSFSDEKPTFSQSETDELQDTILPREFSGMKSGGPDNDWCVEAIVNKAGRNFNASGSNALRVVFNQRG